MMEPSGPATPLWIGTYPAAGLGTTPGLGEGLWSGSMDASGVLTAAQTITLAAPSFVAIHPLHPVGYAISETQPTVVTAFSTLEPRGVLSSLDIGGDGGCHTLLGADGTTLYVAHYGSGELTVVGLDESGLPVRVEQSFGHDGSGPRADRQEGPHAHFVGYAPGGKHVLVADLGTDQLRCYAVRKDGSLEHPEIAAQLPPGSGPRHFAVRREHIYVVCELDHALRTFRWDGPSASAAMIAEQPVTLAPLKSGNTAYDAHAQIVPGNSGDVLLASVRGPDVVSVFDLAPEGEARYRAAVGVGEWPRHFTAAAGRLVVVAERGHEVRSYDLDAVLGLPPESENGAVAELPYERVAVVSPACVAAR